MRFYFLILPILIGNFLLTDSAIPADRSSGTNSTRWGITTNQPVEETEDEKDEVSGEEAELKNNQKDDLKEKKTTGLEANPTDAASEEKGDAGVNKQTKGNKSTENKFVKEKQSDTIAPGKTKENGNKDSGEQSKKPKENEALIKWKNETQKAQCNAYLDSLKESFLKARYYSIQGVPCGTAENARSFMTLIDQCKQDCPDGLLKRSGYTKRIIRNLSWLEKLGTERCPDMNKSLPQTHTDAHRQQNKEME